jgi:uncharacterized membrane protein (UPF0127 family)
MKLIYENKNIDIIDCNTFFSRLIGFMFKKNITNALLFNKCNSIHTFFMKSNIDVIMCDKENNIIHYYNNLKKNKVILPKKKVYRTIELPVNYYDIKLNTKIRIE